MTKLAAVVISALAALGFWASVGTFAQAAAPAAPQEQSETVRSATLLTLHGKITEVNKAKKQLTLEAPNGRRVILTVENPYNLKAVHVGDSVVVRYYEMVTIRKKKANETVPTASVQDGISTAKPGGVPSGIAEQKISLLLSIEAIDTAKGTVTVKAPDGTVETVRARNPKNLARLQVGEELVVTLSRATAIGIEKEQGSSTAP